MLIYSLDLILRTTVLQAKQKTCERQGTEIVTSLYRIILQIN